MKKKKIRKEKGYLIVRCKNCGKTISHEYFLKGHIDQKVKFFKNVVKLRSCGVFWRGECKCGSKFAYLKPGIFSFKEILQSLRRDEFVLETRNYLRPAKELKINFWIGWNLIIHIV